MAIITWNSIIEYASGRDGDFVYYRWRNINCSRIYVKQDDPDTPLQRSNRSMFSMAVRTWQEKAPEEKEVYAKRAVNLNMSGYNLYISEYMKAGVSCKKDNNADKPGAGIAESLYGHGRFGIASPPFQLRFFFYPAFNLLSSGAGKYRFRRKKGYIPSLNRCRVLKNRCIITGKSWLTQNDRQRYGLP